MPDGTDATVAAHTRTAPDEVERLTDVRSLSDGEIDSALSRYEITAELGRSGCARTFSGYDPILTRRVAVTVFASGADPSSEFRRWRETRILADLDHPGLVRIYDAGDDGRRGFVVSQLVTGPTLADRLREVGTLSLGTALSVGADLAGALDAVHRHGLVHRTVTARCVRFDVHGRVFLTGLDTAATGSSNESAVITADDLEPDAGAHLAPEQIAGEAVGAASDVYALGSLLLECLGSRGRPSPSPAEPGPGSRSSSPPIPSELPDGLRALLAAMTAHRPDERPDPDHVADHLHRLDAALRDANPGAPTETPPARTVDSPAPHPQADIGEHDLGASAATNVRLAEPEGDAQSPGSVGSVSPSTRPSRWRAAAAVAGVAVVAVLAGALGAGWLLRATPHPPPTPPPAVLTGPPPAVLTGPPTLFGRVLQVVDPTTVSVDVQGQRVDVVVLGLDANVPACAYAGAMEFARRTLDEQTVTVVPDPTVAASADHQAYLVLGTQLSYTDAAISAGWVSPGSRPTRYTSVFEREAQRARDSGVGMFAPPCTVPS